MGDNPASVLLNGFLDACRIHRTFYFVAVSPIVGKKRAQCFILNGAIFLGSIAFKSFVLMPFLAYMGSFMHSSVDETNHAEVDAVKSTASWTIYFILATTNVRNQLLAQYNMVSRHCRSCFQSYSWYILSPDALFAGRT